MPVSYSFNRIRNAEFHQKCDLLPDDHFADLGILRDDIKNLQSELQGKIVLPGDTNYNKDRMLSNPLFDYFPTMIVYCAIESDVYSALTFARQKAAQRHGQAESDNVVIIGKAFLPVGEPPGQLRVGSQITY